jgi:ribosomal protein S18 acetylase RimI-like enzyme
MTLLRVTYMELRERPPPPNARQGPERIALESPGLQNYLSLYRQVGAPLGWDQRLQMPEADLAALLNSGSLAISVLRTEHNQPLGFCELDRHSPQEIEVKNFGLITAAQGRGLGPWLLRTALHQAWQSNTQRIWLHTDTWDHPSAINVYERAGFKIYAVREEASGPL